MKINKLTLFLVATLSFLSGCSSTTITKTTYSDDGVTVASIEKTETSESPIVVAFASMENKHVIAHIGGWYAGIGVDPSTSTYGIKAGTVDSTYASFLATKDGVITDASIVAQYFPAIVDASKYSLSITSDGVNSDGSTDDTQSITEISKEEE